MAASLRSRLGRALLVALSPVLALGALDGVLNYRDEASDRRQILLASARQSAAEVRARMRSGAVVLAAVAPEAAGEACVPRLRTLAAQLDYQNLVRLDASGRVTCAADEIAAGRFRSDSAWFRRLRDGASFVAGPATGAMNASPAMLAASRLEGPGGRFDGALVSVISLSSLQPVVEAGALPPGTEVAVADGAGRLYAATDTTAFATPEEVRGAERLIAESADLYRASDRDGVWRDHVAAPLIGREVFVLVSTPAPGLFSWARLNLIASILIPIVAFLAAFGAVWLATDRLIIRWLNYLQRIAAVYARGRFAVRPQVAADAPAEVQGLAGTLDEMAEAITRRDQMLRDNLDQKDALLREIHHRVKNNLQVITSLLNLQQRSLKDPAGRAVLADTRQRIGALALIYRALYQSEDLRRVDVRSFLEELVAQLVNSEGPRAHVIRAEVRADELSMDPDKLAPFALFAVEAVTNAQKHGFGDGDGAIRVDFKVLDGEAVLTVADDGAGVDPEVVTGGVGRTLMTAFARQLRGKAELGPAPSGGYVAKLSFPAPDSSLTGTNLESGR